MSVGKAALATHHAGPPKDTLKQSSAARVVRLAERVLLIVPCLNEAESIGALIDEIHELGDGYDILVIDDASKDETSAVALRSGATCVRLIKNLGIGGAVQTGIKYALANDYDFCVQIDGDGQHPPAEIARLLALHRQTSANIVVGSRHLGDGAFRSSPSRRAGAAIIGTALKWLFAASVTDPTSGMRLMDRRAIAYFAQVYPHDFPEPISIGMGLRNGLSMTETPVEMRARETGASSIIGLKPLAYMFRVLGYLLLVRLRRPGARHA